MTNRSRRVVLVVEDELLIRMCAVDALIECGFVVVQAEHSAAAILTASGHPRIDLLFTDVNMPGEMNGIDLAEHLHAAHPALKIIVTSALPLARTVDHLGAQFLAKPYEMMDLCDAADKALAA
jgi:CheY-like chemotaxis protein